MHVRTDEKTMRITQELPHGNRPLCEKAKSIQTVQIHMENSSFPLSISEMKKLLVQH